MVKIKSILNEILGNIKPGREDVKSINDETKLILGKINKALNKKKIKAKAIVGGSLAKDTFLKGDHDIDIFILFDYSYKDKDISKLLSSALKCFKGIKTIHGSRDYYQLNSKTFAFEIVPVLNIKEPELAENVMDMSPLHISWVKKNKKMTDEIRLAKAFCKAHSCYGAESYIKGFSGHVLDIITIYYKGFLPLIKAATKWKPKVVIDYFNIYKGKAIAKLNKSKTAGPLIVIDPVMPERNAAATLNNENFYKLKKAAQLFLAKPSKKFFVKERFSLEKLKQRAKGKKLILLNITALAGKEDIIGAKLLKAFDYITKQLLIKEFRTAKNGWEWNKKRKALFWYITDKKDLPEFEKRIGPLLKQKKHANAFKAKHKKFFVQKGRVYAKVKRDYRKAEKLIQDLAKERYVKEKIKSAKIKCIL